MVSNSENSTKSDNSTWRAICLTLFPELFPGPLGASVTGTALDKGLWALDTINFRDFATDKHRSVDDTPAGGGPGMVLRPDIAAKAIDTAVDLCPTARRIYLSPRGRPFDQALAREFAASDGLILVCGRFEGLDERVIETRQLEEVSIGDFVMTGGEMAVYCLLDAVVRLKEGVLGAQSSLDNESFENGLLEHPQYTRPREFEGEVIPEVLLSGDHGKIEQWRFEQSLKITKERRPDLFQAYNSKE
ncbi:MAG: tRNA (guanosine(37)-N1)-methyltransferase TrmD [Rhizobiales bacterium]|nr:tRNA (guanosine(37)-N1)-methyltransferase TrmD [Hyphomicrobiales bacterium]